MFCKIKKTQICFICFPCYSKQKIVLKNSKPRVFKLKLFLMWKNSNYFLVFERLPCPKAGINHKSMSTIVASKFEKGIKAEVGKGSQGL